MAHITGGGMEGNLCRVIPEGLTAEINLSLIDVLPIFKYIKLYGNISDREMLNTFNCGVGFVLVVPEKSKNEVMQHVNRFYKCYEIGGITKSERKIDLMNHINWL
jgi:phosphoribosylformylglycinamidine cyclo-ligase